MQYIGLDLHAKSFNLAVLDETGQVLWQQKRATSGESLVQLVLRAIYNISMRVSTLLRGDGLDRVAPAEHYRCRVDLCDVLE